MLSEHQALVLPLCIYHVIKTHKNPIEAKRDSKRLSKLPGSYTFKVAETVPKARLV